MNETDVLRDLLEQAAPQHPDVDPTSRAASVARRGRNARVRDRALLTVAAVSVVAVVVAIPRISGGDDGPDRVTPAPPTVQAEQCPAQPVEVSKPMAALDLGDVVAVRACPAAGEQGDPLPTEPLVGDAAAAFAEDVELLPAYTMPPFCMVANVMSEPWALQVQTADGTTYLFGSSMRICSSVSVSGAERGVDAVLAAFEGNLVGIPDRLSCPTGDRLADGAPTWNASFNPAEAKSGVICYRKDPMGARAYPDEAGTLDDQQLATIRDDLVANLSPTPGDGQCTDTGPQRLLILENPQGDQAAFVDEMCIGEFAGARGYWTPSNDSEDAIAAALGDPVRR